jgi:hypothetical protein
LHIYLNHLHVVILLGYLEKVDDPVIESDSHHTGECLPVQAHGHGDVVTCPVQGSPLLAHPPHLECTDWVGGRIDGTLVPGHAEVADVAINALEGVLQGGYDEDEVCICCGIMLTFILWDVEVPNGLLEAVQVELELGLL